MWLDRQSARVCIAELRMPFGVNLARVKGSKWHERICNIYSKTYTEGSDPFTYAKRCSIEDINDALIIAMELYYGE